MVRRVNDDLVHAMAAASSGGIQSETGTTMRLAQDQFDILVGLLTPGYELALAYKAQMEGHVAPAEPTPPIDNAGTFDEAAGKRDPSEQGSG